MAETEAKSVFETPVDDAEEARVDAAADGEIDDGKGVPHARVREWLAKLGNGETLHLPGKLTMQVIWSPSALREVARIFDYL
jgi:hypothetical protein